MVQLGYALDWPKYSNSYYAAEQDAAMVAKVGAWAGMFDRPWDWRAQRRHPK